MENKVDKTEQNIALEAKKEWHNPEIQQLDVKSTKSGTFPGTEGDTSDGRTHYTRVS